MNLYSLYSENSYFVTPNIDKGIHSIEEIKDIILNNEKISKTTENTITNPPMDSKVFIPLNTAFPKITKKPRSSSYLLFIVFIMLDLSKELFFFNDSLP